VADCTLRIVVAHGIASTVLRLKRIMALDMLAKFTTPTRTCKRCNIEQDAAQFATWGEVCVTCKRAALERRDARNKYAGYTPAQKRAIYKYRASL